MSCWDAGFKRLWVQVDNQQLEQIFLGLSKLERSDLRPTCVNIARILLQLLDKQWRPRTDISPFVEWDRRSYNCLADHAANVALQNEADFSVGDLQAVSDAMRGQAQIRLSTDGAMKRDGQAAVGMEQQRTADLVSFNFQNVP